MADENKLRQILLNLISNACKFTWNGEVTIRTGMRSRNRSSWVVFDVADTGIGIEPENAARLFQEFVQLDASATRRVGGTGLGLSISGRLCAMMRGFITVDSVPRHGSTFTVWLPPAPGDNSKNRLAPSGG